MEAIRINKIIEKDGEIYATGLPCKKGEHVEMILMIESATTPKRSHLTSDQLLRSGIVGLWKDRKDIGNSSDYARKLREQAQNRNHK